MNVLLAQHWLARYAGGGVPARHWEPVSRKSASCDGAPTWRSSCSACEHLASERLGDLPYGTVRIVEIVAAVAAGPDLLLLDEATAGLDPEESHALGDRFLALRDELGLTLVVIEHHVPLVARVCDYAYCLESGSLIAEGTPAVVTAQPQVITSFLGRRRGRDRGSSAMSATTSLCTSRACARAMGHCRCCSRSTSTCGRARSSR